MPRALEPNQRFPVVLESDLTKPAESRPTFYAKSLSMRDQAALGDLIDKMESEAGSAKELFETCKDTLMDCLTGWANMGEYEFSRESLDAVLAYDEARQLLRKVMANQHVQPEEKKS